MSSKRKVPQTTGSTAGDETDDHAAKKRKVPSDGETPESTTQVGLKFLEQINAARDKKNRIIVTHFLVLPDKKKIPEYYEEIGLPIALDIIEGKINRREYPSVTTLESDLRRMVSNAKSFNEKSSEIFSDAEKVRKFMVNFMAQHNPAYESGDYTPFATPVPHGWQDRLLRKQDERPDADADGETDEDDMPRTTNRSSTAAVDLSTPAVEARRGSSTPAVQDAEGAGENFEGNTFQQAQEKIMTEMINLKNNQGQYISTSFLNLPSRDLRDYYRLIKHPVCLRSAQKAVRGVKGREKPTGQTFLKSWQAFEAEISYIWSNAREYNEDGSEIVMLAGQLETYFNRRLAEAKKVVAEPPQPKVKIRMPAKSPEPPKITLRFGAQKSNGSSGISVDNEALKRQQDLVKAGTNGQGFSLNNGSLRPGLRDSLGRSSSQPEAPQIPSFQSVSLDKAKNASIEQPSASANGIKSEVSSTKSPALGAVQLNRELNSSSESRQSSNAGTSTMPPPSSVTPRLASQSPYPPVAGINSHGWGTQPAATAYDPRLRQPGKDASDALITNLSISTHPGLKLDQHFHLDIPASSTMTQQSVTINLPKTHHYLRIVPTTASNLLQRPSKILVTVGMQRTSAMPQQPHEHDLRRPLYEVRLMEGVNRIEVEIVAGPPRGTPKIGSGPDIEVERFTVFINLAKG